MIKITISYRRGRTPRRLLEGSSTGSARFTDGTRCSDIDSVPPGIDFRDHIANALHSSDIVVIIIGPRWLGRAQGGHSRIDAETDFRSDRGRETALEPRDACHPRANWHNADAAPGTTARTLRELPFVMRLGSTTGRLRPAHGAIVRDLNEIIESRTAERDAVEPGRGALGGSAHPTRERDRTTNGRGRQFSSALAYSFFSLSPVSVLSHSRHLRVKNRCL